MEQVAAIHLIPISVQKGSLQSFYRPTLPGNPNAASEAGEAERAGCRSLGRTRQKSGDMVDVVHLARYVVYRHDIVKHDGLDTLWHFSCSSPAFCCEENPAETDQEHRTNERRLRGFGYLVLRITKALDTCCTYLLVLCQL